MDYVQNLTVTKMGTEKLNLVIKWGMGAMQCQWMNIDRGVKNKTQVTVSFLLEIVKWVPMYTHNEYDV